MIKNPHALTNLGGLTYAYDNNGNLTSKGAWSYAWDYTNHMILAGNGTAASTYAYDHTGQRIKKTAAGITTTYPTKYFNITTATSTEHIFTPSGELVATFIDTGTATSTQYIHTDHLGGTGVVTDINGNQIELTDYYPYGAQRINEGSVTEQRKYTGHEYDTDADLTYANARYYDQGIGRWMSEDPIFLLVGDQKFGNKFEGNWRYDSDQKKRDESRVELWQYLSNPQSLNAYSYVVNNPLKYTDPNGEFEIHFNFTTNAGGGGAVGNTWSFGVASDGSYGISVGWHGGAFVGADASIGGEIGFSNAKTWSDTGGRNIYAGGGLKIGIGGSANANFSDDGSLSGFDVGVGVGPSTPVYSGSGFSYNTVIINRSVKKDFKNMQQSISNSVNSTVNSVKQGVEKIINKFSK